MSNHIRSTCAYCDRLADGREDWFPRWLGKYNGMQLLLDRICDECNRTFGRTLDQAMSRESPQAFNRSLMQIGGRHGGPPNLFNYKSQQARPPVAMNVTTPCSDFRPHLEVVPGSNPPHSRFARQLIFEKPDGTKDSIRIKDISPEDNGEWLRQAIRNRDLENARLTEMYSEPEDAAAPNDQREPIRWLRRALLFAFPQSNAQAQVHGILVHWLVEGEHEQQSVAVTLRIDTPINSIRALAKIAFHYALTVDRTVTGREEEFLAVRSFIKDGGDPSQFVNMNARPFIIETGTARRGIQHFLFMEVDASEDLIVRMHFFVEGSAISGAPVVFGIPPIRVRLGPYPHLSKPRAGHALRLFAEPVDGFDGEILRLEFGEVEGLSGVLPPPWAGRKAST